MSAAKPLTRMTASREKLFRAAMHLIGIAGPEKVTVDQIAGAAGVAKGTVYYQFGSKNDLVKALLGQGFEAMMAALTSHSDEPDPMVALEGMVGDALDFLADYDGYAQLWISELLRPNSPWREQVLAMRAEVLALIVAAVRRLERPAGPPAPGEAEALALALFGATYVSGMDAARQHPRDARVRAIMSGVRGYLAG